MDLEILLFPVLLYLGILLIGAGVLIQWHKPKPPDDEVKAQSVTAGVGCAGCLLVAFYITGILASVISILYYLWKFLHG